MTSSPVKNEGATFDIDERIREIIGTANVAVTVIKPGGAHADFFNEAIFSALRSNAYIPDDFVNDGWDMSKLEEGGGKGGTLMAKVGTAYIVKELSDGDHKTLLKITQSYYDHVREGETTLCPIYLHFCDTRSGRKFFVMRNSVGAGPFKELYDLKGCADDKLLVADGKSVKCVHKRIWNVGMWLNHGGWSDERKRYHEGKQAARAVNILMSTTQRTQFLRCLRRDTDWLAAANLMDYSLLVAVQERSSNGAHAGVSTVEQKPLLCKVPGAGEIAVYIAIIDFLQLWTNGKKVAKIIKTLERNKATEPPKFYADRFYNHFETHVSGTAVD